VHIGPFLFDHLGIPYTGCTAHSIYLSSHKTLAKQHLLANKINTPAFFTWQSLAEADENLISSPFIVKSLWEHASFGLDESKQLLFSTKEELVHRMGMETRPDALFCEEYIHGREFNLSVLDSPNGPQVLPPAEIRFSFPDDKPRILGYKAKWDEESFEYKNTMRSFDFPAHDNQLLQDLEKTALQCWEIFELKGYARVDFRVDDHDKIYVLEINANPCISPDSGFVAAAGMAGLNNTDIVSRIIPNA
jgi:D-alanine-D-alanine ligase